MGSDRVKLTKCNKVEWGEKYHYACDFLNEPMFNLLFYCHITILPLWSKLSGKFQRFNAIYGSIKRQNNS